MATTEEATSPGDAQDRGGSGVGVLGWLGFVIINVAAWGIIGVSSAIAWPLGFAITLAYTGILMGMACCLQRYGARYAAFENLLWVLACWFVFILGLYLTFNVVGPAFDEESANPAGGGSYSPPNNDLLRLLPANSSNELRRWASTNDWREVSVPTFANFQGYVFFRGLPSSLAASTTSDAVLLRSNTSETVTVVPRLTYAQSFTTFDSKLFFLAQEEGSGKSSALWSISSSGAASAQAMEVKGFDNYASLEHLTQDGGTLYFKAAYDCPGSGWTRSVYASDGTAAGTADLRGPGAGCRSAAPGGPEEPEDSDIIDMDDKPTAQLWSILFLADVPMLVVAAIVLAKKKMHGLFMNLFIGSGLVVVLVYLIAITDVSTIPAFLKWFVTLYTGAAYLTITLASLLPQHLPELVEKMKDWIVVIVGLPFFVIIHIDLEIPVTQLVLPWLAYTVLAVVQMLISIAVARVLPMVFGAVSTFIIAWKISREIVRLIFGDGLGEMATLTMLGILALQGIGIIAAAILYATKRQAVDAAVRGALLRCLRRKDMEPDRTVQPDQPSQEQEPSPA